MLLAASEDSLAPFAVLPPVEAGAAPRAPRKTQEERIEQVAKSTDAELMAWFVMVRGGSPETKASYTSNLRRLGWYCRSQGMRSIRDLEIEDWDGFAAYLANPPASHCSASKHPYGHEAWRPFVGPLKPSSVRLVLTICRGFYQWLADPSVAALPYNPVSTARSARVHVSESASGIERFLPTSLWSLVNEGIEAMYPLESDLTPGRARQRDRMIARARWVVRLGLHTGLRASEIARADTSMLVPSRLDPKRLLQLKIVRKGNKEGLVPLSPELIEQFAVYLRSCGIAWRPGQPGQPIPLVMQAASDRLDAMLSSRCDRKQVWRIVKAAMKGAADYAESRGDFAAQLRLSQTSTHWLRHSFGTTVLEAGSNLNDARVLLDHEDLRTTSVYTHSTEAGLRKANDAFTEHVRRVVQAPD
jgi:site-specific recombinase XerD